MVCIIASKFIHSIGEGFDNFLKGEKKDVEVDDKNSDGDVNKKSGNKDSDTEGGDASGEKSSPKKKNDDFNAGGVFGSFRSQRSNNNTRNNSEGGNGGRNDMPPNFTGTSLLAALILAVFMYTMIRNGDENTVPQSDFSREITYVEHTKMNTQIFVSVQMMKSGTIAMKNYCTGHRSFGKCCITHSGLETRAF